MNRKTKTKTKDIQIVSRKNKNLKKPKSIKSHFEGSRRNLNKKKKSEKEEISNFKDLNFLESDDLFIIMTNKDKENFIENLRKDAYFLKNHNIMDYSLLYVIADDNAEMKEVINKNSYKVWRSLKSCPEFKSEVWSFAIIDYLQEFNKFKYLESRYKELMNYKNSYYVSCINPKTYSERFINFMNSIMCSLMTDRDSVS